MSELLTAQVLSVFTSVSFYAITMRWSSLCIGGGRTVRCRWRSFTVGIRGAHGGGALCWGQGRGVDDRLVGYRWSNARLIGRLVVMVLVLDLLEVLLSGSHLCILQLLHMKRLTISEKLLPLILQLQTQYTYMQIHFQLKIQFS